MFRLNGLVALQLRSLSSKVNSSANWLRDKKLDDLVPTKPTQSVINKDLLPPRTQIDAETIELLERLSLVNCANKEGIKTLEEAIRFADQILVVNTEGVEPLVSVLEDRPLELREDVVTEGSCREEILSNAAVTEEDYFIAPPGNIALEPRENPLFDDEEAKMLMRNFTKIVEMCEQHGFFKYVDEGKNHLAIRPIGALLRENLRQEWLTSMLSWKDCNIFLDASDSLSTAFDHVKMLCSENLPFGIAKICTDANGTASMESTLFTPPSTSLNFFHLLQRHRKFWWRRIAADPGVYKLADMQTGSNGSQIVEIQSEYPWRTYSLETLTYFPKGHPELSANQLKAKDGRKKVTAGSICFKVNLDTALLNAVCDAYDEMMIQNEPRYAFLFHRKLAPYKIGFSIPQASANNVTLNELAEFLCRNLRKNDISCLLLPNLFDSTLENQWKRMDHLGVPYTLVLNETSLKNGIINLRSRDTTLKEQIHVSDIPDYILKIFKNY